MNMEKEYDAKSEEEFVSSFHEKVLLVRVASHGISNQRKDKTATDDVAETFGGDAKMGRYVKDLFSKDSLKPVNKAKKDVMDYLKLATIYPYGSSGWYVLPAVSFNTYRADMNSLKVAYDDAVEKFVDRYDINIENSKERLGDLFKEDDYITKESLKERFKIEFLFDLVPSGNQVDTLIKEIASEDISDLKSKIVEQNEKALAEGQKLIWEKLYGFMKRVIDSLSKPDRTDKNGNTKSPIFKKVTVEGLQELVSLLTKLNITNDSEMESMRNQMEESIIMKVTAEELRDNSVMRKELVEETKKLMEMIPQE